MFEEKGIKQILLAENLKKFYIVNSHVCNRRQPRLERAVLNSKNT